MRVDFPHAAKHDVPWELFVAAWKIWVQTHWPEVADEWRNMALPRHNRAIGLEQQIAEGRAFSLDVLCRLLVSISYRNTMHATNVFLRANTNLVEPYGKVPHRGREVNAARLRSGPGSGLAVWDELSIEQQDEWQSAARARLARIDEFIRMPTSAKTPARRRARRPRRGFSDLEAADVSARSRYLEALMLQIHSEEFQPQLRNRDQGETVRGWPERLKSYFWPNPSTGYRETARIWQEFAAQAGPLSAALEAGRAWTDQEKRDAFELAERILAWGRVRQRGMTGDDVELVFRSALQGTAEPGAPMNSGWTKVAAFATVHREGQSDPYPHAIWDSRVSTSVVSRLDDLLDRDGVVDSQRLFPGVGFVPGRGGKRKQLELRLKWPDVYQRWSGHYAGSAVVKELRDLLNASGMAAMPTPDGREAKWTIMGVSNVLFMDGY